VRDTLIAMDWQCSKQSAQVENMNKSQSESEKFDVVVRTLLSVSHEEIQRRDKEWHRKRAKKKRAKTSPASRASGSKA
jgi:U3 small nucleolar ribonucleoprotein component